ncbi:hypothetical protein QJS04_geneDACA008626 [Acorus gramineus]|uniref:Uncharacterized protein n=1 Tax=Acorus gramineus TaxID=55184 RepID=A0AAV9AJK9_ACOGR|nr:hypothetical protein QJS04_geneDACA008626 [Acorus gramineus]
MAAPAIARRSINLRRYIHKSNGWDAPSPLRPSPPTFRAPKKSPNLPNPPLSSPRRASVVLNSLLPFHSTVASSQLVSRVPFGAGASLEGRFANYISPI